MSLKSAYLSPVLLAFVAMLFSYATPLAWGRVLYVSPAGGAGGDGSEGAPFSNPADAVAACEMGDTIIFRQGSYRITRPLYLDRRGITLTALAGERAILAGVSVKVEELPCVLAVVSSNVTISGLSVRGGFYGIKLEPASGESIRGVKLQELKIGDTGADCIKSTNSDQMTIESCDIGPSGSIQKDNAEGIDIIGSLTVTVRNCTIHDVATNGIYFKGGTRNGAVEYCTIRNAGHGGILLGQDTDREYMRGGVKNEAINCVARENLIVNTGAAGLGAYSASNVRFENNTLVNVARDGQAGLWVVTNSREVPTERAAFRGNIVHLESARPMVFLKDPGDRPGFERNLYHSRHGDPVFRREIASLQKSDEWTFTAWQKAIGGDLDSIVADPELNEKDDFRPHPASRAKAFGRQSASRPTTTSPVSGVSRLRSQIGGGRE